MSNKIICQGTNCKKNGCHRCGGYGYVLVEKPCESCGHKYWQRPGNYTIYNGKVITSFDGLKIIHYIDSKIECAKCQEQE